MTNPDAELIAACEAFNALQRKINSLFGPAPGSIDNDNERDAAIGPLHRASVPHFNRLCELPATTLEGTRGKLRALYLNNADLRDPGWEPIDRPDHIIVSLVSDISEDEDQAIAAAGLTGMLTRMRGAAPP